MAYGFPVQAGCGELRPLRELRHFPVGQPRGFIPVNLVEEELVRVVIVAQDIEAQASGFVAHRVHGIVLDNLQKLAQRRRLDMDFNGMQIMAIPPLFMGASETGLHLSLGYWPQAGMGAGGG